MWDRWKMAESKERGHVAGSVRRYFTDAPDTDVYVNTIAGETGLTRKQIMNAIGSRKFQGDPIETIVSGQIYRWVSGGKATAKEAPVPKTQAASVDMFLMAHIGTLNSDEMILQDTDTRALYRATPLK
jgi:hypothetical protein